MAFLEVGGVAIRDPSVFQVTIQDISSADSGRTQDGLMHKDVIAQKRTIALEWWATTPAETKAILDAFMASTYFTVKYWDPTNTTAQLTKTFYAGDMSAPVQQFYSGGEMYTKVSFTIIER